MKYLRIEGDLFDISFEDHGEEVRVYVHNLDVDLGYREVEMVRDWLNEWLAAEKEIKKV